MYFTWGLVITIIFLNMIICLLVLRDCLENKSSTFFKPFLLIPIYKMKCKTSYTRVHIGQNLSPVNSDNLEKSSLQILKVPRHRNA